MSTISTGCTAARPGHEIGTFWHADQGQLRLRILKAVHPAYARKVEAFGRFVAYDVSLEAAAAVCSLVQDGPAALRSQQDQAVRAVARVPLSVMEGRGRLGRDSKHLYRVAYSSAGEVMACIELLVAVNAVDAERGRAALALLDRSRALIWGLMRTAA